MMETTAQTVVDAIRLAMAGSDNDATRVRIISSLLEEAPETNPADVKSPRLLIDTIYALGGSVKVPA